MTKLAQRQCGPCKACCIYLEIEDLALQKKAGTPCPHLNGTGCSIYDSRPETCAKFLCGWRLFAELNDDWRPDQSGVLALRKAPDELPAAWRTAPYGLQLAIIGGEEAITRPGFAQTVVALMQKGVPVLMSAASPATVLNEHMDADLDTVRRRLPQVYRLVAATRWRSKPLMIAPLYRLQLDRQRYLFERKARETS